MALDFPSSPTNGQTFGNYTYDSTAGAWRSSALYSMGLPIGGAASTILTKNSGSNYDTSWTATPTLTSITTTGTATVGTDLTVTGETYLNGTEVQGDGKTMLRYSDTWLRVNEDNDFTSGIYTGTGILRTDGNFQVGGSGGTLNVTGSAFTYNGNNVLVNNRNVKFGSTSVGLSNQGLVAPMYFSSFVISVAFGFTPTTIVMTSLSPGMLAYVNVSAWNSTSITGYITRLNAYHPSPATINWVAYA